VNKLMRILILKTRVNLKPHESLLKASNKMGELKFSLSVNEREQKIKRTTSYFRFRDKFVTLCLPSDLLR
jgi:hypothetical protein